MRVAIFHGAGTPITIERVPDPEPEPDQMIVRIGRCGICGSDVSMTSGGPFQFPAECRMGHEYAGEVVEIGRDVAKFRVGDRVAARPGARCGACESCRKGESVFCFASRSQRGGFGDYVAVAERTAVRLPDHVSLADGALIEPIACGRRALRIAGWQGTERLLVLGGGSMAFAMLYWARRLGAGRIVAATRSAHRREALLAMGADAVHSFDEDDPEELQQRLGGPPDIVAECVGKPGALAQAVSLVRQCGTVLSMGMCQGSEQLVPAACAFKEVKLLFPLVYTTEDYIETARAFETGPIRPDRVVSDVIPLDELPRAIESLRAGTKQSLKIQVDPRL